MRYPLINKQIVLVVTEDQKKMLIDAAEKSYRTVASITREGAIKVATQILKQEAVSQ